MRRADAPAPSTTASRRPCAACSRIPNSSIGARSRPRLCAAGGTYRISDLALASRLSFFLWSSMPDDELLTLAEQGRLARAGGAREAGAPDDGRSEVGGADRELRGSVAEPARAGHRDAESQRLSGFRRQPAARVSPRGRAPVRQHRPGGPQRPGPADRGLHVRRRTARPPLRDSERLRQPVPARDVLVPTSTCGVGCSGRAP